MVSLLTLRRKLQKKKKRKERKLCGLCRSHKVVRVTKYCERHETYHLASVCTNPACGYKTEMTWTGVPG